jgi:spore maturation protein CgeB
VRTAVIGEFYPESFAQNVAGGLHALGHDVGRISMAPPAWAKQLRLVAVWNRMRLIPSRNPAMSLLFKGFRDRLRDLGSRDLVVVTHDYLSAEAVEIVRASTGAKIAFWFPDSISVWNRSLFLNAPYDAVFLKDPYAVHQLRAFTQLPVYYLPECFDPAAYAGFAGGGIPERFRVDVTTAGNCYAFRVAALAGLAKYNARIWGGTAPSWMRTGPIGPLLMKEYVANLTKVQAFRGAKIVVNSLHPAEVWGVNARAFEVAGCSAFQLISWRPALAQLFLDGEELVSYSSIDDLEVKIDEFLTRPLRRARIARAGGLRARRDHTYAHRLGVLIRTVNGDAAGHDVTVPSSLQAANGAPNSAPPSL